MQLSPDFFDWIDSHAADDATRLRLKYGADRAFEILQIECRRKYAAKLRDTLATRPDFIFPTALSGEQSTSEPIANFHASLIAEGDKVADLTAGLGIDAMVLARRASKVITIERDAIVAEALAHNTGLQVENCDCRDFIERCNEHFDCIFIDPARRATDGSRLYALDQCEPDVVAMLPRLRQICDTLIIKASPMLDIAHTLSLLPEAVEAIVVGTTTECKELDVICRFNCSVAEPTIRAVTIGTGEFSFTRSEEVSSTATFATPQVGQYVYDPYPAVMKAGAHKLLSQRFALTKPHPNTHLWFGDKLIDNFPGHVFKVEDIQSYASKNIKRFATSHPLVSVTTRNFDTNADVLRAKLKVKDGPKRLFALTDLCAGKLLITCSPIET